jgi:hypothetical protein
MEIRFFKTISGGFVRVLFPGLLACLILTVQSCKKSGEAPRGILSRDQMVTVLSEMYITEEKVHRLNIPRDSSEQIFALMEGKVYEKTGVPDSVFAASLDYYTDRPLEMELIYSALVDSLHLMEQRAPSRLHSTE